MRNAKWTVLLVLVFVRALPAQNKTEQLDAARLKVARQLLAAAEVDTSARLEQKRCADFFGGSAKAALQSTDFRILSYGTTQFREGRIHVPVAETIPNHKMVVINLDGPFFDQRAQVGGAIKWFKGIQPGTKSTTLSNGEFRVLLLLHELGHVIGKFGPDTAHIDDSRLHSDSVIEHCF